MDDRNIGRDYGIQCPKCGGRTVCTFDDGLEMRGFDCVNCDESILVQFEIPDDNDDADEYEYEPF
jgi:transcription elongation factor Elf1